MIGVMLNAKMTTSDKTSVCYKCYAGAGELKRRLLHYPRPHVWALTAYDLICRKDWASAHVAFSLVKGGDTKRCQITTSLQPLCDLRQLKVSVKPLLHIYVRPRSWAYFQIPESI